GANGKQIATDETWSTAIGSQFSSLLIEQAGNAGNNAFGVYEIGNTANRLEIFPGSQGANQNVSTVLQISVNSLTVGANSITLSGTSFGFYLQTSPTTFYYSQSSLNTDGGLDHMVTYGV